MPLPYITTYIAFVHSLNMKRILELDSTTREQTKSKRYVCISMGRKRFETAERSHWWSGEWRRRWKVGKSQTILVLREQNYGRKWMLRRLKIQKVNESVSSEHRNSLTCLFCYSLLDASQTQPYTCMSRWFLFRSFWIQFVKFPSRWPSDSRSSTTIPFSA